MEIRKIGEHLNIKNIVIHQLLKDAGTTLVSEKQAQNLLTIGDREQIFLGNLEKSYHKKSSPIYGIFADEEPTFKNHLVDYLDGKTDFYDFSVLVKSHYKIILQNTINATGGYMILCEYSDTKSNCDMLLVLMINNKDGYVVDEDNLTLSDIKNLDLSKVDVACLINLTEWQNIENNVETNRTTYLSFVKGIKTVSVYFMRFIDVDNKSTGTESTNRLIKAFEGYAIEEEWDRETKQKIKNEVFSYCLDQMKNKNEILLSHISNLINPNAPEAFSEFATEDQYRVSAVISGDRAKMKLQKTISYKGNDLQIEFDTTRVMNQSIRLDPNGTILTIKDVPPQLRDNIREITGDA